MVDQPESLELLKQIKRLLERGSLSTQQRSIEESRSSRRGRSYDPDMKSINDERSKLVKNLKALNEQTKKEIKETEKGRASLENLNESINDVSRLMSHEIHKDLSEYGRLSRKSIYSMYDSFKEMNANTRSLSSHLAISQKNSALMSAALLESRENIEDGSFMYKKVMSDLKMSVGSLDKTFLLQQGLLDEITGEFKKDLSTEEFSRLRISLGQAESIITESLSKLNIPELGSILSDPNKLAEIMRVRAGTTEGLAGDTQIKMMQDAILDAAVQLEMAGHDLGLSVTRLNEQTGRREIDVSRVKKIKSAENQSEALGMTFEQLAGKVGEFGNRSKSAAVAIDQVALKSNALFNTYTDLGLITAKLKGRMSELVTSAGIIANLAAAGQHIKEVYKEIVDFNIAHIPASFLQTNIQALRLGMSFEQTVKFLDSNRRLMGIYTREQTADFLSTTESTFEKFGYNMQQAAGAIGPTLETAISTGVDIRDPAKLNDFIENTTASFNKLGPIIGGTIEDFAKYNQELTASADVADTLLGLDKERAFQYSKQLMQERDYLVTQGLSLQQAQEMVKAQEAAKREKVTSRIRGAAMMALQAQQAGMSQEDIQRAMKIRMQGRAASAEDIAWMTATFSKDFAQATSQFQNQLVGSGNAAGQIIIDSFGEATGDIGEFGKVVTAGAELAKIEKAGAKPQITAEKAAAAAPSESVAQLSNIVNTISSVLENNLLKALGAAALGIGGLGFQAALAAKSLSLLSGKSIIGSLAEGGKGILGKLGGIFRGTGGAGAAGGAAGGTAGGAAGGTAGGAAGGLGRIMGGASAAGGGGFLQSISSGLMSFANPLVLKGSVIFGLSIAAIGAGIAGATWLVGKTLPTLAEGLQSLASVNGEALKNNALGIIATGGALLAIAPIGIIGMAAGLGFKSLADGLLQLSLVDSTKLNAVADSMKNIKENSPGIGQTISAGIAGLVSKWFGIGITSPGQAGQMGINAPAEAFNQGTAQIPPGINSLEMQESSPTLAKLTEIAAGIKESVELLQIIASKELRYGAERAGLTANRSSQFSLSDMNQITPGLSYISGRT